LKLLYLLILSYPLFSTTTNNNFNVTSIINGTCYINSISNLNFGNYNKTFTNDTEGTNEINIICSKRTRYDVILDGGLSGDVNDRIMYSGTNELHYNIYKRSDYQTVLEKVRSRRQNKTFTGYGLIPKNQDIDSGVYSDVITATIIY
jgi:spore coat protein U-like protein